MNSERDRLRIVKRCDVTWACEWQNRRFVRKSDAEMATRETPAEFEKSRIKALQEERLHIQKKTFTKWINSFLQKVKKNSNNRLGMWMTNCELFAGPDGRGRSVHRSSRWKEAFEAPRDHLWREAWKAKQWPNAGTQNRERQQELGFSSYQGT